MYRWKFKRTRKVYRNRAWGHAIYHDPDDFERRHVNHRRAGHRHSRYRRGRAQQRQGW